MTQLHPDSDWLTDYAAGSLDDSHALCVSAHLQHCSTCRAEVEQLARVGGALLDAASPENDNATERKDNAANNVAESCAIDDDQVEQTLAMLPPMERPEQDSAEGTPVESSASLPRAIKTLAPAGLESLPWKRFGKNLSIADIAKVDDKREVALHRLEPGAAVAHHDHSGREITVVLTGSFSDRNGQYYPGDFIVREPGEQHQPTASENTSCVCLSVTEAPVRFTGPLTRLFNPILAYRHPR